MANTDIIEFAVQCVLCDNFISRTLVVQDEEGLYRFPPYPAACQVCKSVNHTLSLTRQPQGVEINDHPKSAKSVGTAQ